MGSTASIDQNKASYRLALRQQDWLCAAAHKLDLRPTPTPKKLRLPVSRGGETPPVASESLLPIAVVVAVVDRLVAQPA
jgi:hypothetical protein